MALVNENFAPTTNTITAFADRVVRFFDALRAGQAAAADFERFSYMSDEALASKGLSRETVSRAIMERHFG